MFCCNIAWEEVWWWWRTAPSCQTDFPPSIPPASAAAALMLPAGRYVQASFPATSVENPSNLQSILEGTCLISHFNYYVSSMTQPHLHTLSNPKKYTKHYLEITLKFNLFFTQFGKQHQRPASPWRKYGLQIIGRPESKVLSSSGKIFPPGAS